ncbi:dipeptidyl aminopeptidase [Duganella sp. Leaf126]|nr:dipeptidyl aminopeptidase [Duganella sp. Leaf126]
MALAAAGSPLTAAQAADTAATAPPPIADFFANPEFSGALLSPSGKYLAVRMGAKDQRDRLAVVTLADNSVKVVASFSDADIGNFQWVNDERLVFTATDRTVGQGDARYAPGLYAINRDATKFVQLASRSAKPFITSGDSLVRSRDLLPWNTYLLGQKSAQDSEFVYVEQPDITAPGQVRKVRLLRLNTLNGRWTPVHGAPDDSRHWLLDDKGEPRIVTTFSKGVDTIMYRDPATDAWRELVHYNAYTGGKGSFTPRAFGPDGTLYVVTYAGKNTASLRKFDFATNEVAQQPLVVLDGYDFKGSLLTAQGKLLGVRYLTDARGTAWFDADMKALQARIDAMLPNTINLIDAPTRPEAPWMLITAYGDLFPSRTLLYNSATDKLTMVGISHPNIKPEQMAHQTLVHYKARDGLEIPAWLTVPKGSGKHLPLVVLVHGGPYVRGNSWGWDAAGQFLASRGYAVLEPEYRGSTGFGTRLFRAGWKQWGLKMQDDIADGARWAIAEGTADPKRICIAGASYGGYATLMGLINDKDLYKCGIDWAGVTDINMLYDGHWNFTSDLAEEWKHYGMPQLVGDQVKDAEQLKATSPLLRAAEITQPLLLAYGGADMRVPLPHGTKFYNAVRQTNPNVEWIEYPEEGHGWALPKNRIDFWGRVEKFLDKQIGQAGAAP